MKQRKIQSKSKKIVLSLKYNTKQYIQAHYKRQLSFLSQKQASEKSELIEKNRSPYKKTKIPLLASFRTKRIKKNFMTHKLLSKQKTVNLTQLPKISKLASRNMSIQQKSLKSNLKISVASPKYHEKAPIHLLKNSVDKTANLKKKNIIETNLYVDAKTLNYERISEIIKLEIENDENKSFDNRKLYLKIRVYSIIFLSAKKLNIKILYQYF